MIIWYEGIAGFGGGQKFIGPAIIPQMIAATVEAPEGIPDFYVFESETTVYLFDSETPEFTFT